MKIYGLPKEERLSHQKQINMLFTKGKVLYQPDICLYWLSTTITEANSPQVLFAVPKKNIRRATERNKVKRWLREAYRLHKQILIVPPSNTLLLGFVYKRKLVQPNNYKVLTTQVKQALAGLKDLLHKKIVTPFDTSTKRLQPGDKALKQ